MIDREELRHLATLARLTLAENEIEKLTHHLKRILSYVERIKEINLEEEEPLISLAEKQGLREDKQSEDTNFDNIKQNFPQRDGDYLRVPKIL